VKRQAATLRVTTVDLRPALTSLYLRPNLQFGGSRLHHKSLEVEPPDKSAGGLWDYPHFNLSSVFWQPFVYPIQNAKCLYQHEPLVNTISELSHLIYQGSEAISLSWLLSPRRQVREHTSTALFTHANQLPIFTPLFENMNIL
jgi:hypothetical protein